MKEKRDVSMMMEDETEVFKSDYPSDNLRKKSSEAQKRKSTPVKGTCNPSTVDVLEQLASTSAPLPLNLEDAARSPALKKAMMENPQGEKHQIETLRNLRMVFISSHWPKVSKF